MRCSYRAVSFHTGFYEFSLLGSKSLIAHPLGLHRFALSCRQLQNRGFFMSCGPFLLIPTLASRCVLTDQARRRRMDRPEWCGSHLVDYLLISNSSTSKISTALGPIFPPGRGFSP